MRVVATWIEYRIDDEIDELKAGHTKELTSLREQYEAKIHALEEQVIDDVEQMHFAAGEYIPDGETPVAVIAKDKMREWSDWFKTINLEPDVVLPQMLALPTSTGAWYAQVGDTAVVHGRRNRNLLSRMEKRYLHGEVDETKVVEALVRTYIK